MYDGFVFCVCSFKVVFLLRQRVVHSKKALLFCRSLGMLALCHSLLHTFQFQTKSVIHVFMILVVLQDLACRFWSETQHLVFENI